MFPPHIPLFTYNPLLIRSERTSRSFFEWKQKKCTYQDTLSSLIIDDETLCKCDKTKLIAIFPWDSASLPTSLKSLTSFLNIIHGSLISLLEDKIQEWSGRTDINIFSDLIRTTSLIVSQQYYHLELTSVKKLLLSFIFCFIWFSIFYYILYSLLCCTVIVGFLKAELTSPVLTEGNFGNWCFLIILLDIPSCLGPGPVREGGSVLTWSLSIWENGWAWQDLEFLISVGSVCCVVLTPDFISNLVTLKWRLLWVKPFPTKEYLSSLKKSLSQ